jgi:hypothetical protein
LRRDCHTGRLDFAEPLNRREELCHVGPPTPLRRFGLVETAEIDKTMGECIANLDRRQLVVDVREQRNLVRRLASPAVQRSLHAMRIPTECPEAL